MFSKVKSAGKPIEEAVTLQAYFGSCITSGNPSCKLAHDRSRTRSGVSNGNAMCNIDILN